MKWVREYVRERRAWGLRVAAHGFIVTPRRPRHDVTGLVPSLMFVWGLKFKSTFTQATCGRCNHVLDTPQARAGSLVRGENFSPPSGCKGHPVFGAVTTSPISFPPWTIIIARCCQNATRPRCLRNTACWGVGCTMVAVGGEEETLA